jgi:hypothetical protein
MTSADLELFARRLEMPSDKIIVSSWSNDGMPARKSIMKAGKVRLLAGGNPQVPMGHGEAPVKAYLAALPGWQRAVGRKIDALVTRATPRVRKAVKYNSPLYGTDGETWFLSIRCFDRYLKVCFFRGTQLDPTPPVASKTPHARYLHVGESDAIDEKQFIAWVKQASLLPGEKL